MKKFILGASAALMLVATACATNEEATADKFVVDEATCDTVAICYGKMTGNYMLSDYTNLTNDSLIPADKNAVLKGLRVVFATPDNDATYYGMQVGLSVIRQIQSLEQQGIAIDKTTVMRYIIEEFSKDSVDVVSAQAIEAKINTIMEGVAKDRQAFEDKKAAEAPEAVQNGIAGKAFVDKLKAKDAEIKTSESGLSYKITNPGEAAEITDQTILTVKYRGSLTDGTVFDESSEEGANFSPANVIRGFGEGLKMLGKGGVATFYIPGELAYGVHGVPQAGIGPNQTLIFEVEILDVK